MSSLVSEPREIVRQALVAALPRPTTGAHERDGAAVLLLGERGIGRSTLLDEAIRAAQCSGARVLHTAGSEGESLLQFAALERLLDPLMHLVGELTEAHRVALLTAMGRETGALPDRFLVSMAARTLVNRAARAAPILLAVDDLDHLDVSSRDVVTFLARRLDRHPVSVLATASEYSVIRDSLSGYAEHLLPRMSAGESMRLLASVAPALDPKQRAWVMEHAVGNPLALVELSRLAEEMTPASVEPLDLLVTLTPALERAFGGRIGKLSGVERDALLVAAVAAEDSTQEILAATQLLAGVAVTTEVLDPAAYLGLLTYDDSRVRFHHPLMRSAVAGRESVSRRQSAHRALGFAVNVNSARRIWHQASSTTGPDDDLAEALEAHARECFAHGDPGRSVRALRRAAALTSDETGRGRRLLAAAGSALAQGDFTIARELHAKAVAKELTQVDWIRADVMGDEFDAGFSQAERRGRLAEAAVQAERNGDVQGAIELAYGAAFRGFLQPREKGAAAPTPHSSPIRASSGDDERRIAITALLDPVARAAEVIPALHAFDAASAGPDGLLALAVAGRAVGDYTRGLELLALAETASESLGRFGTLGRVLGLAADMALEVGDWTRARTSLRRAQALSPSAADSDRQANLLATAARAAALSGDTSEALVLTARIELMVSAGPGSSALAKSQTTRGIALIVEGRHQDALTVLQRVFDSADARHHPVEQFGAVTFLAEAAARCGRADVADTIVARLLPTARTCPSPLIAAHLASARAVLAPAEDAEEWYLGGLASDLSAWPWHRARLQLAYGRWLRRHRQVARSREPLRTALEQFEELAAPAWAAEARIELDATTQRSDHDREAAPTLSSLSAQELAIAHLVAAGMSNSEIGQHLSLSPRTVGSHLYRLFPKLGITARSQIAPRLAVEHAG